MAFPKQEEFEELFRYVQEYQIREGWDGMFTAKNPVLDSVSYRAFASGVKLYEVKRRNFAQAEELTDILKKPFRIDSLNTFAWVLFCKLKERRELLFPSEKHSKF